MSRTDDGRCLHCDGPGCDASVPVPVVLAGVRTSPPPRWLFVQEQTEWKHYCPSCAAKIVARHRIRRFGDSFPPKAP